MELTLHNNHFTLLWQRAIYWHEQRALILSDSHFGKAAHFRKEGIAVPGALFNADLQTLDALVTRLNPEEVIIIGDMFHSGHNKEVDRFGTWREQKKRVRFKLAKGNHDILARHVYLQMQIEIEDAFHIGPFTFAHEPVTGIQHLICFTGHIHPGIRIEGKARQSLHFPCFHFSGTTCTLPAFSIFTGLYSIKPQPEDQIFLIAKQEIIRWK